MGSRRKAILVVEDEPAVRAIATRVLERAGFEIHACATADEAAAALSQRLVDPDLVLTDLSMPGDLDGLAFAAWLHASAPTLPVVLMSGDAGMLEKAQSAPGVRDVLAKPFGIDELLAVTAASLA